jgi:hypothetical protein
MGVFRFDPAVRVGQVGPAVFSSAPSSSFTYPTSSQNWGAYRRTEARVALAVVGLAAILASIPQTIAPAQASQVPYLRPLADYRVAERPLAPFLTPFALAVPARHMIVAATHQRPDIEPQSWLAPQAGFLTPRALDIPALTLPSAVTHQRPDIEPQVWPRNTTAGTVVVATYVPPATLPLAWLRDAPEQQQGTPPLAAFVTPFALAVPAVGPSPAAYWRQAATLPLDRPPGIYPAPVVSFVFATVIPRPLVQRVDTPQPAAAMAARAPSAPADVPAGLGLSPAAYGRVVTSTPAPSMGLAAIDASMPFVFRLPLQDAAYVRPPVDAQRVVRRVLADSPPYVFTGARVQHWAAYWREQRFERSLQRPIAPSEWPIAPPFVAVDRIYVVTAEGRTYIPAAELRVYSITGQSRTLIV